MLMKRLGYTRFVAQGNWGAAVTQAMGEQEAPEPAPAYTTNMPGTAPPEIAGLLTGEAPPPGLYPRKAARTSSWSDFYAKHVAYAQIMTTRPQTLYGYGDSPVDLAACILDHGDGNRSQGSWNRLSTARETAPTHRRPPRQHHAVWSTNTGMSAARLYWDINASLLRSEEHLYPYAMSVFRDELYQAPRSWTERAYPNKLIYYNELDRGGHFAAWEQPQLFSEEMRAAFRTLR